MIDLAYRNRIITCFQRHSARFRFPLLQIVPQLDGPVATPHNDTGIVVTEFGWADMKGSTPRERGKALIGIAHPDFREALERSLYVSPSG